MLVSATPGSRQRHGQGSLAAVLAELQRREAAPSESDDGFRQRLLVFKRRLSRVRALGNGHAQVELSPHVLRALGEQAPSV